MASVMVFASSAMCFAGETAVQTTVDTPSAVSAPAAPEVKKPPRNPEFKKRQEAFEKRLKLTDEQKAQAKELRQKSFEQMKPIMENTTLPMMERVYSIGDMAGERYHSPSRNM